jgi:hypothetical protein
MGEILLFQNVLPKEETVLEIIKSNLIIHLDATNETSYPGTGTTWFNLAQDNYHFTLTNGSFYEASDPSIQMGDGKKANTPNIPPEFLGNPNLTISMWVKRTGTNISGYGNWGIGGGTTYKGICSWWNNLTDRISLDVWSGGTYVAPSEASYPLNQWAFITFQKIAGSMTTSNTILWNNLNSYTGGQLTVSRNNTTTPDITNQNNYGVTIGEHTPIGNTVSFRGRFAEVMFYNRVLTPEEIAYNYNTTKSKFGL